MSSCCCPPLDDGDDLLLPLEQRKSDGNLSVKRKCTDCSYCMIFLLVLGSAAAIAVTALHEGNPERLIFGVDYAGVLCGSGDLAHKPFIYYPRLAEDLHSNRDLLSSSPWAIPLYGVCVESCPTLGDYVSDYNCERGHARCRWRPHAAETWYEQRDNAWHVGAHSMSIMRRCMPTLSETSETVELCVYPDCEQAGAECYAEQFPEKRYWRPDAAPALRVRCEQVVTLQTTRTTSARSSQLELDFIETTFGGILGIMTDMYLAAFEIVSFGVVMSLVVNFAVLFVLRYFVRTLFYATVVLLVGVLTAVNLGAFAQAGVLTLPALTESSGDSVDRFTASNALKAFRESSEGNGTGMWMLGGYVSLALSLALLVFIYLLWSKVENALEICREATKAVFDNKVLVALPLVSTAVSIVTMGYLVAVLAFIVTPDRQSIAEQIGQFAEDLTQHTLEITSDVADAAVDVTQAAIEGANELANSSFHQSHLIDIELDSLSLDDAFDASAFGNLSSALAPSDVVMTAVAVQVVASLWALFFVYALVYATIAGVITYWYQERSGKGVVRALYRVVRYHLGSLALGSAVLALVTPWRMLFGYITSSTRADHEAPLLQLVAGCMAYGLKCFDRCLKYLTKYSYVYVAAEGIPFCRAAVRTFALTSKHPLQMLTAHATLNVLTLLVAFLTPLSCAVVSYLAVLGQWRAHLRQASGAMDTVPSGGDGDGDDNAVVPSLGFGPLDGWVARHAAELELQDWDVTGPPRAATVFCATLVVSFWITQMFRMVYSATVDTLFMCMFSDDDYLSGKYGGGERQHARGAPPRSPGAPNTPTSPPPHTPGCARS